MQGNNKYKDYIRTADDHFSDTCTSTERLSLVNVGKLSE